jgi:hypothetical protein
MINHVENRVLFTKVYFAIFGMIGIPTEPFGLAVTTVTNTRFYSMRDSHQSSEILSLTSIIVFSANIQLSSPKTAETSEIRALGGVLPGVLNPAP